mgnify:FL=1
MGESAAAKRAGGHGLPPARKLWALWSCDLSRAAKPDAVSHQGGAAAGSRKLLKLALHRGQPL